MTPEDFRNNLLAHLGDLHTALATEQGDWVVKGFIDIYRNIYPYLLRKGGSGRN